MDHPAAASVPAAPWVPALRVSRSLFRQTCYHLVVVYTLLMRCGCEPVICLLCQSFEHTAEECVLRRIAVEGVRPDFNRLDEGRVVERVMVQDRGIHVIGRASGGIVPLPN